MSNPHGIGPVVELVQRQTPIPLGNQQHCYVHTATGELNATAPPKSLARQQQGGLAQGHAGPLPASLPPSGSNPVVFGPGGNLQPPAPGHWLTSAGDAVGDDKRSMGVSECRALLGETSFTLLRGAMMAQQDLFLEQLWELHRLARVQGRKALQPDLEGSSDSMAAESRNVGSTIFSREHQEALRVDTMDAIFALPTVPESLKRGRSRKPVPSVLGATVDVPGLRCGPSAGPAGTMSTLASLGTDALPLSRLPGNSTVPSGISGFGLLSPSPQNVPMPSVPGVSTGSLQGLCNLNAPSGSSPPGSAIGGAAANTQQSLLDLMLPGLSSSMDPHAQWFQKNGGGDRSKMSMPLSHAPPLLDPLGDTSAPTLSVSQTAPSASAWSGQSLVALPNAQPPPTWSMPHCNPLGPRPTPPMGAYSGLPSDGLLGSGGPGRRGLATANTLAAPEGMPGTMLADANGKYTDTSAASILLSLKGETGHLRPSS